MGPIMVAVRGLLYRRGRSLTVFSVAVVAMTTLGLIALIWFTLVVALETHLKDREDKIFAGSLSTT